MSSFRHNLAVGAPFDTPPPADLNMQICITCLCSESCSFPISDRDGRIQSLLDPISPPPLLPSPSDMVTSPIYGIRSYMPQQMRISQDQL